MITEKNNQCPQHSKHNKKEIALTLSCQRQRSAKVSHPGQTMDLTATDLSFLALLCMLSVVTQPAVASQRAEREDPRRARYKLDLFEGDIKISSKEIETYYEDDSDSNEQSTNSNVSL